MIVEYGVESKKASLSIWQPRFVPDPEKEEPFPLPSHTPTRLLDLFLSIRAGLEAEWKDEEEKEDREG